MTLLEALSRKCDACFSPPGERCTAPTDTGRRPVNWVHYVREHEPYTAEA